MCIIENRYEKLSTTWRWSTRTAAWSSAITPWQNTHIDNTYDAAGNKLRTTVGRQRVIGPIRPFSLGEGAGPQGGGLTGGLPGGEIVNPIPSSTLITTDHYANATDFDGVTGREYALAYDASGSLAGDEGRGMTRVDYDLVGNPLRIQFTDGSVTRYIYSTAGEKLRVVHLTAVPNITVAMGQTRELAPSEILAADSTDYLLGGSLTMKNGRIDRYQFDGGYCQAVKTPSNPAKDTFMFHYYDRDHLGSVRQVILANGTNKGTLVQKMDYYPSGLLFCDGNSDGDVQPVRFSGKELDRMHGLGTYDFGARQYNPVTGGRFTSMDPMAEKYYNISPYTYCGGDPVKLIDPSGKEWELAFDNGKLSINVTVNLSYDEGLSDETISDYKNEVSSTLNRIISKSSKGSISASVTFYSGNEKITQELRIGIIENSIVAGSTWDMISFVNAYDRHNQLKSSKTLAIDVAHELFHTIGLGHPFESNQTLDTQLVKIDKNSFISTPQTDPNIQHNVMNYESIIIDGEYCSNLQFLTMGQMRLIVNEILHRSK